MTAEKSVANVQSHLMGGGVSEQLVCWRSHWYFLEWKDSPTERTGGRCYAHNKTSCNTINIYKYVCFATLTLDLTVGFGLIF